MRPPSQINTSPMLCRAVRRVGARLRLYVLTLTACISSAAPAAERRSDEKLLRDAWRDTDAAAELATGTRDDVLAAAALAAYVAGTGTLTTPDAVRLIGKVAGRPARFAPVAVILAFSNQGILPIQQLVDNADAELAAAVLAYRAQGALVAARLKATEAAAPSAKGKGQKGGRGRRRGGKLELGAQLRVESIPAKLFLDRSEACRELAVLAAAWAGLKAGADEIAAIRPRSRGVEAAIALYRARTGIDTDPKQLAVLLAACLRERAAITRSGAELSAYDLRAHPACHVCEAIGTLKAEALVPQLGQALFHEDLRVQVAAARALRAIGSATALPVLAKRLPDCAWPVLVEVAAAFAEMPDHRAIPGLIRRLAAETGRCRLDLVYALSCIAGERQGGTAAEWQAWLAAAGRDFRVDPAVSAAFRNHHRLQEMDVPSLGFFYGLPIYSDRLCYVVDSSKSMQGDRIKSLKYNLQISVERLRDGVYYNIIDFGGDLNQMDRHGLSRNRRDAESYIRYIDLSYATRSYDAMVMATALDEVDTVYFLSDGAPVHGQLDPWPDIRIGWQLLNRYRPVAMFCVDFDPRAGNQRQMAALAAENAGQSASIDVQAAAGMAEDDADR